MGDTVDGNLGVANAIQLSKDFEGYDTISKEFLKNKEVLAVILQEAVSEYQGYTKKEIMDFIEGSSISSNTDVSNGRTNTRIRGENTEFNVLNEKTSNFDILFRAVNPVLSNDKLLVHLHIDIEPQKNYKPGYPIEKRGIYYLAREVSSQLSIVTEKTDYNELEKCYSIWICCDNIPKDEQCSESIYRFLNVKNIGHCITLEENYDLMEMIIIRLGEADDVEMNSLIRFLNAIFLPRKADFMNTMKDYIDFTENDSLKQEVESMTGWGRYIYEDGKQDGKQEGEIKGKIIARYEDGMELEKIAARMELTVEEVKAVLKEKGLLDE